MSEIKMSIIWEFEITHFTYEHIPLLNSNRPYGKCVRDMS